jgi:hypothetical protein
MPSPDTRNRYAGWRLSCQTPPSSCPHCLNDDDTRWKNLYKLLFRCCVCGARVERESRV